MPQRDSEPPSDLARRCRSGDADALAEVFRRYSARLAQVAEGLVGARLARREGPDDVVQSVFRTFCRRCTEGRLAINDAGHLWRLLVRMTVLKARAKGRRRSVTAEADGDEWLLDCASREPGPEEAAALVDLIEALVEGVDPVYARVLEMRMQGLSAAEIASQLNRSRQGVYRILGFFEQRLRVACWEE